MKNLLLALTLISVSSQTTNLFADIHEATSSVIDAAIDAGFSELERQIIESYYGKSGPTQNDKAKKEKKKEPKKMPPGLAKKEQLPPGLAKQLERNGTLPPGLARRELPHELEKQLPKLKDELERTIVDTSVVLVEKATGLVVDVIKDVVTGN